MGGFFEKNRQIKIKAYPLKKRGYAFGNLIASFEYNVQHKYVNLKKLSLQNYSIFINKYINNITLSSQKPNIVII